MTNTIGTIYSDFIKEEFIRERLRGGSIPTAEEIDSAVAEAQLRFNNFNSPLTREEIYAVEEDEPSSASKMNETFRLLQSDLAVSIKSLLLQGNTMTDMYDSTYTRLEGFNRKLEKVQTRIDTLLFESKNSERHEEIFHERFETTGMVDMVNTTAEIDDLSNSTVLRSSRSSVIPLAGAADSIEVVTQPSPIVINSSPINGLGIENLLNTTNNVWQHQVRTSEPAASMYVEVIIRVPSTSKEINKIVLEPAGGDIKTQINLEISHSEDGLNWIFPDGENKKRLYKRTTFDFKKVQAEYWKLRLTKLGNDGFFGNNYVYNFGLKNVLFLGKEYEKVNRHDISYVYSKVINPAKIDKINAVNLQICESLPFRTEIKYELAPLVQTQIDDLESETIGVEDLRYYIADLADRDSFTLDMLRLVSEPTIDDILASDTLSYKDQNPYNYLLDEAIVSDMSKNDTTLLRNAGDNTQFSLLGKTDSIRDISPGWAFSGLFYSTFVLIEDVNGVIIDVGDTKIMINGKELSGKVKLTTGLNHITSPKEHWESVDITSLPPTADFQVDPLYPYNHKYLIEGVGDILYGQDMTQLVGGSTVLDIMDPDQVYRTTRSNWEFRMNEISFEDFNSKDKSALDVFSYKVDNTSQERAVVKSVDENGLLDRERFSIITKIQNSEPVKAMIFKATLATEDTKTTPVLSEYLLKFR